MAQQAAFPHPTDRRSISASIAGIPLTKLKKDSTKGSIDISQHNSPRESPFLSPPITPVERDDVPYKPTEQDYFSLRQRRPQKARRRANRTSELSSSGAARSPPTSPASIISFDAGSVVISEQNTQHDEQGHFPRHSLHQPTQFSVLASSSDVIEVHDLAHSPVELKSATSESIPYNFRLNVLGEPSSRINQSEGSLRRPKVRKSTSRAIKSLRAVSNLPEEPTNPSPESPKDTPAMITLRQASLPTSLRQSNSNRQESGIGQPLSIRRAVSPLIKSASRNIVSHPLLKASRTGNTNRKSSAETALTLVQAYAKLTGSEDATSNLAERRGSAMAVIVTGQGSHEIIWRYDDTPSSNSSSSSGRQSRIAEAVVSSPQITAA